MYVRAYKPLLGIHGAMVLFLSCRGMTIRVYCTSYSIYMNLESDIQDATNRTICQLLYIRAVQFMRTMSPIFKTLTYIHSRNPDAVAISNTREGICPMKTRGTRKKA